MVAKIRVLSEQAINEIAAGEVIENPASVVKELTENAIDADASQITIEIKLGGRQLIRISDDGYGMSHDDALLCLERHATSKIKSAAEIFEIATLGFRGEAIPSIAAISKFLLLTCARGFEEGSLVIVDGGRFVSSGPAARSPGTTIEVKQLFFNVPVRKKFQRSSTFDTQEVEKICQALALAYPQKGFHLVSNSETLFRVPVARENLSTSEALAERVRTLLGEQMYNALQPLDIKWEGMVLTGFVALPHLHRPNRSGQHLFINGRAVTAPFLAHCIKDSYSTLLPSNRHPLFILSLHLPPGSVDVNVHPQKREVRFLRENMLRELMQRALATALPGSGMLPKPNIDTTTVEVRPASLSVSRTEEIAWLPPLEQLALTDSLPVPEAKPLAPLPIRSLPWEEARPLPTLSLDQPKVVPPVLATLEGYFLLHPQAALDSPLLSKPCTAVPALFLVDQRRVHQRILYEKLSNASQVPCISQTLLFPYSWELLPQDSTLLEAQQSALATMGLLFTQLGPFTWSLEAVPKCLSEVEIPLFLEQLLQTLRTEARAQDALVPMLAKHLCAAVGKASLSSRHRLSLMEAHALLEQLYQCEQQAFCPQGQLIAVCLSYEELQRRFNFL